MGVSEDEEETRRLEETLSALHALGVAAHARTDELQEANLVLQKKLRFNQKVCSELEVRQAVGISIDPPQAIPPLTPMSVHSFWLLLACFSKFLIW